MVVVAVVVDDGGDGGTDGGGGRARGDLLADLRALSDPNALRPVQEEADKRAAAVACELDSADVQTLLLDHVL